MPRAPTGRHRAGAALALLLAAMGVPSAVAQADPPAPLELALQGQVEHPRILATAELQALPSVLVEIGRTEAGGAQRMSSTAALLWTLLITAGPADEPGKRTFLQHTPSARGRDGYAQDGKPLPALRVVIPAGAHAGCNVRDVVAIEVR